MMDCCHSYSEAVGCWTGEEVFCYRDGVPSCCVGGERASSVLILDGVHVTLDHHQPPIYIYEMDNVLAKLAYPIESINGKGKVRVNFLNKMRLLVAG